MRHIFLSCLLSWALSGFAQDTLLIRDDMFVMDEQQRCIGVENQLDCVDSLIVLWINKSDFTGKANENRQYYRFRKLSIYHINAGYIQHRRGNKEEAFRYYNLAENYLDTLSRYGSLTGRVQGYRTTIDVLRERMCAEIYFTDTALFQQQHCARYFPELSTEAEKESDTLRVSAQNHPVERVKRKRLDAFYSNDTLLFNPKMVNDSISIHYFNTHKRRILSNLIHNPLHEGMRVLEYEKTDTLFLKITLNNEDRKMSRECVVLYANAHEIVIGHYLSLFTRMDFPYHKGNITLYIPIVIRPEKPNNYNKMEKTVVNGDHFLIEYEKLKPIPLD